MMAVELASRVTAAGAGAGGICWADAGSAPIPRMREVARARRVGRPEASRTAVFLHVKIGRPSERPISIRRARGFRMLEEGREVLRQQGALVEDDLAAGDLPGGAIPTQRVEATAD